MAGKAHADDAIHEILARPDRRTPLRHGRCRRGHRSFRYRLRRLPHRLRRPSGRDRSGATRRAASTRAWPASTATWTSRTCPTPPSWRRRIAAPATTMWPRPTSSTGVPGWASRPTSRPAPSATAATPSCPSTIPDSRVHPAEPAGHLRRVPRGSGPHRRAATSASSTPSRSTRKVCTARRRPAGKDTGRHLQRLPLHRGLGPPHPAAG